MTSCLTSASISKMRSTLKLARSRIALAASFGTMPDSARVSVAATSTANQVRKRCPDTDFFSNCTITPGGELIAHVGLLRFAHAGGTANHWMAGMRHLFDDSIVLADDSSLRWSMAVATKIAVPPADAGMDGDV